MNDFNNNVLNLAYLNVHGQSGIKLEKQLQIEEFIRTNNIDILHCQEINIGEDTFAESNFISSSYNIICNNSPNKYGTASMVKNEYNVENIFQDTTCGRIEIRF